MVSEAAQEEALERAGVERVRQECHSTHRCRHANKAVAANALLEALKNCYSD